MAAHTTGINCTQDDAHACTLLETEEAHYHWHFSSRYKPPSSAGSPHELIVDASPAATRDSDPDDDLFEHVLSLGPPESHFLPIVVDPSTATRIVRSYDGAALAALPQARLVVVSSSTLKAGTVFLVDASDSTVIGRDRANDTRLRVPELQVSKRHCAVYFDRSASPDRPAQWPLVVFDYGSQNGTFINGARLSPARTPSEPTLLRHGATLSVGGLTSFSVHVHGGWPRWCDDCRTTDAEQGKYDQQTREAPDPPAKPTVSEQWSAVEEARTAREHELRRLRRGAAPLRNTRKGIDRAAERRAQVGSVFDLRQQVEAQPTNKQRGEARDRRVGGQGGDAADRHGLGYSA